MSDQEISCPHCRAKIVAPSDAAGTVADCPNCGGQISIPVNGSLQRTPPPAPAADAPRKSGVIKAGWICLVLAVILGIVLFVIPIWGFLFVAAVTLGIIATAQKEKGGLALLLSSLIIAPLVVISMVLVIFVGGCGLVAAGVSKELDRAIKQAERTQSQTIRVTPPRPTKPTPAPKPTVAPREAPVAAPQPPPRQEIVLTDFLEALDRAAQAYGAAQTRLQKETVLEEIRRRAPELLGDARIRIRLQVKDVGMDGNIVTVTHEGLPLDSYLARAEPSLRISDPAMLKVKMSKDQAVKIMPGQTMIVQADIEWVVSYRSAMERMLTGSRLLTVSLAGAPPTVGHLKMNSMRVNFEQE